MMISPQALDQYHWELLQEKLHQGLSVKLIAKGTSMYPMIHSGDILILQKAEPQIGDVILFKNTIGMLLIHRCLWINQNGYYTKGDNLLIFDDFVPKASLIAVVQAVTRNQEKKNRHRYIELLLISLFFMIKKIKYLFFPK